MTSPVQKTKPALSDRIMTSIGEAMVYGSIVFLAIITGLIALQVIGRNIFNVGFPWADELARFSGIALVFFTIPLLQYQGRHIAVDMLSGRFTGLCAKVLWVINELAVLGFCMLMLFSFNAFLKRAGHFPTPATGMPNWLFYSPAMLGIFMCTLATILRLVAIARGTTGPGNPNPADEKKS